MAKILSHVWSSASGSVGGITYFNGPHASIIARARVTPVQPGSLYQMMMRTAWNAASAAWEAMAVADQALWEDYASTVIHEGKQGSYTVTGRSMFMAGFSMSSYIHTRGLASLTFSDTPPAIEGWLLPSNIHIAPISAAGTGFSVQFSADLTDDTVFFIQVSKAFDKERWFWKGPWIRLRDTATICPGGTSSFKDISGLTTGKVYFVRVKCVADDAPVRVSQEWFGRAVAAAYSP